MLLTPFEDVDPYDGYFRQFVPEPNAVFRDVKIRHDYIWHHGPNGPTEREILEVSLAGPITFEHALWEWGKALTASAEKANAQERCYLLEGVHETTADDGTLVFDLMLGT